MERTGLIRNITMAIILLTTFVTTGASAQVIEMNEVRRVRVEKLDEKEKLSESCAATVKSYNEVKRRIDDDIEYLENLAIIGDLVSLREEMERLDALPEKCVKEVGFAIDSLIEKKLGEKPGDVELERLKYAADEMESELMPEYRELSSLFDDVCYVCGKKPKVLAEDPLQCKPEDNDKKLRCSEAMIRYDNGHDALTVRRDLCRQSAKIEGIDQILFWFQGRDDLPLTCAVQVKEFMEGLRHRAEGSSKSSRYAFAVAKEKCGSALFPIYLRYGMAVKGVCDSCRKADKILKKDGMSCY